MYQNPLIKTERKVIFWYGQSNCGRQAARATLPAQYQTSFPLIHEWDGATLFDLDWLTYGNSGAEFSLMTRIQSYYNEDVYFCRGWWGSCGLAVGAGTAGNLTPQPTSSHYPEATGYWNSMLTRYAMTQDSVKFMVLIMGESDARSPYAASYATNLAALISNIRSNLNMPTLAFIITKLSSSITGVTCPEWATINAAIDTVVAGDARVFSVNTNTFPLQADLLHYDATGYDMLGEAVYNVAVANSLLT